MAETLRLAAARDDLTVRYLFGLATLNAASIVAMTTIGGSTSYLSDLQSMPVYVSLASFVAGVVLAGIAIQAHRNNLIERAGSSAALTTTLSTLIDVSATHRCDDGSYGRLSDQQLDLHRKTLKDSAWARWGEALSGSMWLIGAVTLASNLLNA